jgi:hypothetical protein
MSTRINLQDRDSLLYYQDGGQWTSDIGKARDFQQTVKADQFARDLQKPNLHIVMTVGEHQYEV